jgi:hypothetical protein
MYFMHEKQPLLDVDKLVDFQRRKKINDGDYTLWDYLFGIGNIEMGIVFTKLFWPDFVEHEGGIFLSEAFNLQIYEQWKVQLAADGVGLEQVINHQYVNDLLPGVQNVSAENLLFLGQTLVEMWKARLKLLYPQRCFKVKCDWDEHTVVITVFQDFGC